MNIAEILKDCPKGTKLYSPLFGEVELMYVDFTSNTPYPIVIGTNCGEYTLTKDGLFYKEHSNGECMIFPSKENRDWSTFKVPKKCEFKPFDKVLGRDSDNDTWQIDFFSYISNISNYEYQTMTSCYKQCIPYEGNEHLLGTTNNPD